MSLCANGESETVRMGAMPLSLKAQARPKCGGQNKGGAGWDAMPAPLSQDKACAGGRLRHPLLWCYPPKP